MRGENLWNGVQGGLGVGQINKGNEALLSRCALNGLVMNTCLREIHMANPGSKQWHCPDYIIMKQRQKHLCCDVSSF